MEESPRPVVPGEAPSPFDDTPRDPAALKGCSRPVLIGCGVTVLVSAILFLLLIVKAEDMFVWLFENNAEQILANLPADVTDEEEERLRRAFEGASAAVVEGRIDIKGLQDLQAALALAGKRAVTREEILRATEALERVASTPSPFEGDEQSPPAGDEPAPSNAGRRWVPPEIAVAA